MAEEFCAVTGASESEAAEYLERCNGDGKLAMERFFEESKAIEQRRIREGDLGDADEAAEPIDRCETSWPRTGEPSKPSDVPLGWPTPR
eukprot:COSAG04_NODE_313_length_17126_cov_17.159922_2_plen_89_part_00